MDAIPDRTPSAPSAGSLRELAANLQIRTEEIDAAEANGTLRLLVLEHLAIAEPAIYTQDQIVARTGLGGDARRFWRALGFPDPAPDEPVFSATDLEMLQLVDAMIRLQFVERDSALQLARVIGLSVQRIAQAQVDAIAARLDDAPGDDPRAAVLRAESLLPTMPRVIEYAWRRHLQSAIRRRLAGDDVVEDGPAPRAVGFADLVGFTMISQQLDDHALTAVVDRFETRAYDIVNGHGGRVVKMIGDEVMFETADAASAALIGLDLSDTFREDDSVNDIRVGIAFGPALARESDLYGPTVNLASRMVGIAYAGAVVVSGEVHEALRDDDRFAFKNLRARNLKHIGRVHLYALRRAGDTTEGLADRARRRRTVFGERLAELVDRTIEPSAGEEVDGGELYAADAEDAGEEQ